MAVATIRKQSISWQERNSGGTIRSYSLFEPGVSIGLPGCRLKFTCGIGLLPQWLGGRRHSEFCGI